MPAAQPALGARRLEGLAQGVERLGELRLAEAVAQSAEYSWRRSRTSSLTFRSSRTMSAMRPASTRKSSGPMPKRVISATPRRSAPAAVKPSSSGAAW